MADPQSPQEPLKIVSAAPLDDDLKIVQSHVDAGKDVPHPVVARLLDWLPAAGGVIGGVLGAAVGLPEGGIGAIPGGALGAAAGGATGESMRQNVNRMVGNPAPTSAGEAASKIAGEGLLQGAADAVAGGFPIVAGKLATPLMVKAAKPAAKLLEDFRTTAPKLAKTLLDEGVLVTKGGVAKLDKILNSTRSELKDMLATSTELTPKNEIVAPVANTAMKVANQSAPQADLKAIGEHVEGFMNHPKFIGDMTQSELQAMKVANYKKLPYGELGSAVQEADKAMTRGAKEAIEARTPSAKALNQKDAEVAAARIAVAKQVGLAANRDPVGMAYIANNGPKTLAWLLEKSPAVKSLLAHGLYQSASAASGVPQVVLKAIVHSVAGAPDELGGSQ